MGGNTTTSRGGLVREAVAQREAKTEAQTAAMMTRLLVVTTTSATQNNNQPTTGASESR